MPNSQRLPRFACRFADAVVAWRVALLLAAGAYAGIAHSDSPAALPDNETLRHYRALAEPRLSPDARMAIVRVTESTAEGGRSHLWLLDIGGGAPRQLTYAPATDKRGEHAGRWLPDGTGITFLAHRGEHTQLHILPMNTGEAQVLSLKVAPSVDAVTLPEALAPARAGAAPAAPGEVELDVDAYETAPDAKSFAVIARDPEAPAEIQQRDAKADAQWVDHEAHAKRLYLVERATRQVSAVPVPGEVRQIAWRGDGAFLAVVASELHNADDLAPSRSLWIVAATDLAHPRRLATVPATVDRAVWSADGQSVYFHAQASRTAPPGYADLYDVDPASGKVRNWTDGLAGSVTEADPIALAGGGVVQTAEQGVDVRVLVRASPSAPVSATTVPFAVATAIATNARQSGWLMLGSSGGKPPVLYFATSVDAQPRVVQSPPTVPEHTLSIVPRRIQWQHEGMRIDGLLYLPTDAPGARVPLVVEVHGGPTGAYVDRFEPWVDFLVGHGWAVLRTNPRGSTGRGAAFAAANRNDLGGADYRDIMAGVDYVLATAPVDPDRLALMGYSYGGEMAAFVEGKTRRFKALVSGAPVIDQYSEYGTEDNSWYDRWYFGKPWEHPADAWRQSPLAGISSARTPMLLLQGAADVTDPPGQSQEMYRALRQAGVPVDLVLYPRDDHGPLALALYGRPTTEPWHGFDARRRVVAFIDKAFHAQR